MTGASPPCRSSEATSICSISWSTSTSSSTMAADSSSALVDHVERRRARERVAGRRDRGRLARTARRGRGAVVLSDGVGDRGFRRDHRLDVVARHELDVVHGEHVGRIGHRDRQRRAGAAERDDLVLVRGLGRDQLDDAGVDFELREVDRRDAVLLAEERGDLLVLDEPQLDQVEAELPAIGLLIAQRVLQLGRRNPLFFQQQLAYADGHRLRLLAVGPPGTRLKLRSSWGEPYSSTP